MTFPDLDDRFLPVPVTQFIAGSIQKDDPKKSFSFDSKGLNKAVSDYHKKNLEERRRSLETEDLRRLAQLRETGSDFAKIHIFSFGFVSREKGVLLSMRRRIRSQSKTAILEQLDNEGQKYSTFEIGRELPIRLADLFAASSEMEKLAWRFGVQYDSWTAEAKPEND